MKFCWMKFYPGDWMTDPELSMCSPAARGVWIDLISAMHKNHQSGVVSGTIEQLARIARCSPEELVAALTELQATNTADITGLSVTCNAYVTEKYKNVTVENRRMKRDAKVREQSRLRVMRYRGNAQCNADITLEKSDVRVQSTESTPYSPPKKGDCVTGEIEPKNREREAVDFLLSKVGAWFRRRPSTKPSPKEVKAATAVVRSTPSADEIQVVEEWYTARLDPDSDFRRRDVLTLLNNWNGEIDRAKRWKANGKPINTSKPNPRNAGLNQEFVANQPGAVVAHLARLEAQRAAQPGGNVVAAKVAQPGCPPSQDSGNG